MKKKFDLKKNYERQYIKLLLILLLLLFLFYTFKVANSVFFSSNNFNCFTASFIFPAFPAFSISFTIVSILSSNNIVFSSLSSLLVALLLLLLLF